MQPPPPYFGLAVEPSLENRCGQRRAYMQGRQASVLEAVFASGWHNHRLTRAECRLLSVEPDFCRSVQNCQHFLDGMEVGGGSPAGIAELLEYAKVLRARQCRHKHARHDPDAPLIEWLARMVYDVHPASALCLFALR